MQILTNGQNHTCTCQEEIKKQSFWMRVLGAVGDLAEGGNPALSGSYDPLGSMKATVTLIKDSIQIQN